VDDVTDDHAAVRGALSVVLLRLFALVAGLHVKGLS
jgi:hypothetical protein